MLCGQLVSGLRPDQIAQSGLLQVPEGRQVVAPLTVLENLQMAELASKRYPQKELNAEIERIFTMFPNIARRRDVASGLLCGGEQQMLAIGRALIKLPKSNFIWYSLLNRPVFELTPGSWTNFKGFH